MIRSGGTSGTSGLALAGAPRLPKSMLVPARSHSRVRSSAPTRAALSFGRVAAFGAVESRFASIAPAHVPASAHAPAGERCLGRLEARLQQRTDLSVVSVCLLGGLSEREQEVASASSSGLE